MWSTTLLLAPLPVLVPSIMSFRNLSIPIKLTLLSGITITLALFFTSVVSLVYNTRAHRNAKIQQLHTLGEVVASNSTAAISFSQTQAAEQLLHSLSFYPTITNAAIWNNENELFAVYNRSGTVEWTQFHNKDSAYGEAANGSVAIFVPIVDGGETLGRMGILDSMSDLDAAIWNYVKVSALIVALALILGIAVAVPLQQSISRPLIRLASVAKMLTENMDFSVRVEHKSNDEVGVLYQHFNKLIQRVERSDQDARQAQEELHSLNALLEMRVQGRTQQLERTNSELQSKILERDLAHEELKRTQTELIETSRKAGMADIANGVLHNIGNVLNSLNISTSITEKRLRELPIGRMKQAIELMVNNSESLGSFMTQTKQGPLLPGFLSASADRLLVEQEALAAEIRSIAKHVDHIKDIVRAQQSYAGAVGVTESCDPTELVEDAIQFLNDSLKHHDVRLVCEFEPLSPVGVEKAKLIQMLVNLIKNAKESVIQHNGPVRQVTVRTLSGSNDSVHFQVADSGIGISPEQITRIFAQGFTTKKNGHGFGLHASANQAKEMGGRLEVSSDGLGLGATFTIMLPRDPKKKESKSTSVADSPIKTTSSPIPLGSDHNYFANANVPWTVS
jgi:two-component system, NtrC family, sensor kinase